MDKRIRDLKKKARLTRANCYVCGNPIQQGGLYIGNDTWRHEVRCRPLSVNYIKHFPKSLSAKLMEGTDAAA